MANNAFMDGVRLGFDQDQQAFNNARLREADRRAQELHAMDLQARQDAAAQRKMVADAKQGYMDVYAQDGMTPDVQARITARYGLNPEQIKAAGTGLPEQLAKYDNDFDSSDLQSAPTGSDMSAASAIRTGGVDVQGARQRAILAARQRLNAAEGNTQALALGEAEGRGIDVQDRMRQIPALLQDQTFRSKLNGYINRQHPEITIAQQTDSKGKASGPWIATVVQPDGQGKVVPMSEGQYMALAQAHVMASMGDIQGAHAAMAGVNKELAEIIDKSNSTNLQAMKENEAGRHNYATELETSRYHNSHLGILNRQHPTLSENTKKELLDLQRRYAAATTDQERTVLDRQYQMVMARADTEMGKPGQLPRMGVQKPTPDFKYVRGSDGDHFENSHGMPVARMDPKLGMIPLTPNPLTTDKTLEMRATNAGIRVHPGYNADTGAVEWGAITPNGRTFSTVQEALDAMAVTSAAATTTSGSSEMAKRARPAGIPAPSGQGAPYSGNPYVNARGERNPDAPSGAPSLAARVIPQVADAVGSAVSSQYSAYLRGKISRREPLDPAESARARQMGLQ